MAFDDVKQTYQNGFMKHRCRSTAAKKMRQVAAGIEFITDRQGNIYTYDVNMNTNYNSEAEEKEGVFAMLELAKYLGKELAKIENKPLGQR